MVQRQGGKPKGSGVTGATPANKLAGRGVAVVDTMMAVRALALVMADPEVRADPDAIGAKIGCSGAQVTRIMADPMYVGLLRDEMLGQLSGYLNLGAAEIHRIVMGGDKDADKISAYRTLAYAFKTIAESAPAHEDRAGEGALDDLMESLRKSQAKAIQVTGAKK